MSLYDLSSQAENDWHGIVEYTLKNFGEVQVEKYTTDLLSCLEQLVMEEGRFKVLKISDFVILSKKCNKHYVFAWKKESRPLLIIAILHEKMDLMKRLSRRLK